MLSEKMRLIRDLVAGLPQGPGGTSEGPCACISKKTFQKYLDDQKKQGYHLKKLEKAYTDLATVHGTLSTSHAKLENAHTRMKKKEKKRDKFFSHVWKGVKGIWKVLKPQELVPSTKPEDDDDAPIHWSEEEEEEEDATESDSEEST
nr:uncharacterized protein LOC117279819 [Nicotiana tomentosiformis]